MDSFGLFSHSYLSIDGSKFKAVNSKDNNFTLNKLDDRIARLEAHERQYLEDLEKNDFDDERKLGRDETELNLRWFRTVRRITKNIVINWRKVERNNFHSRS